MEAKAKVVVICALVRDHIELSAREDKYKFIYDDSFDWLDDAFVNKGDHTTRNIVTTINQFVEKYRNEKDVIAIFSSCDVGVAIASVVANLLGLPCCPPRNMLQTHHKYYQRQLAEQAVPSINPKFQLFDPTRPDLTAEPPRDFPFFMKPVKSVLSSHAYKIENYADFTKALIDPLPGTVYLNHLSDMVKSSVPDMDSNFCKVLCEDFISGDQCTVDGFVYNKEVTVMGIVDSIMYPGTQSFASFECPSVFPESIQQQLRDITTRIITGLGLNNITFNVEYFYNKESGQIKLIEVNPRFSGQFGDLYEKLCGTNTYDIALDLACGVKPNIKNIGKYSVAASFVCRVFANQYVESIPSEDAIKEVERRFENSKVFVLVKAGTKLSDYIQDAVSFRYCLIHLGANSFEELYANYACCKQLDRKSVV